MGGDLDHAGGLQRAQQPAQVPRVQPEAGPQASHLAALTTDFPQQPGLAERAPAAQEPIVQCPDLLGDNTVEAPDLIHHGIAHLLTVVRDQIDVKAH